MRAEVGAAIDAARAAIGAIAERAGADHTIAKIGDDFATGTDLLSQRLIRERLNKSHPEHRFVGEEAGLDALPRSGSYWLVDPICGTRNFAFRVPLYSVNIALVQDGRAVAGVVVDAAHGTIFAAELGQGAFALGDAGPKAALEVSDRSRMIVLDPGGTTGPAIPHAATVIAAAVRARRWELRALGSTLDLAYLAAGRLAAVWHLSRIHPLHYAAGVVVATEAGAIATDEAGHPWSLAAESVLAAATPALHAELLALTGTASD